MKNQRPKIIYLILDIKNNDYVRHKKYGNDNEKSHYRVYKEEKRADKYLNYLITRYGNRFKKVIFEVNE